MVGNRDLDSKYIHRKRVHCRTQNIKVRYMIDIGPRLDVNIYPESGGVAKLPNPQPTKNKEDKLPVMLTLVATQEKAAPNCHDTKNPIHAVPMYSPYILVPATAHRRIAASTQLVSETTIMVLGSMNPATTAEARRPHINPPL